MLIYFIYLCTEIIRYDKPGIYSFSLQPGQYTIHCYGAQGGDAYLDGNIIQNSGGRGAYTRGTLQKTRESTIFHAFVGGQGSSGPTGPNKGGYNGGGSSGKDTGLFSNQADDASGGGGGATDLRIINFLLSNRIMVAGGGAGGANKCKGSYGGKYLNVCPTSNNVFIEKEGGNIDGKGGDGKNSTLVPGSGGGGGYLGGVGGNESTYSENSYEAVGCGGSSYISGDENCTTIHPFKFLYPEVFVDNHIGDGLFIVEVDYECPSNCFACTSATNCTNCDPYYTLIDDQCIACNDLDNNCLEFNESCKCINCKDGYYLKNDFCYKCPIGCAVCNENGVCSECKPQYFNNSNGQCIKCSSGCNECSLYSNNCDRCHEGFLIYKNKLSRCNECNSSCETCSDGANICETCFDGFYRTEDNKCESCDKSCQQCIDTSTKCTSCDGYCLNETNNQCMKCSSCPLHYFLHSSGVCNRCDQSCKSCHSIQSSFYCFECAEGYYDYIYFPVDNTFACRKCSNNCKICNNISCIECFEGYFKANNGTCIECSIECKNCDESPSHCLECADGYYEIKIENKNYIHCEECGKNCKKCDSNQSCTKCFDNFHLTSSGECVEIETISSCPEGYYLSEEDFYYINECVDICPSGYSEHNGECVFDPTMSFYFSGSIIFTNSLVFSSSYKFSRSFDFSSSLKFLRSFIFSSSLKFSESSYFTQSFLFSQSFEFTNDFSMISDFTFETDVGSKSNEVSSDSLVMQTYEESKETKTKSFLFISSMSKYTEIIDTSTEIVSKSQSLSSKSTTLFQSSIETNILYEIFSTSNCPIPNTGKKNNAGLIIGVVVGIIVIVILLVGTIIYIIHKRRKLKDSTLNEDDINQCRNVETNQSTKTNSITDKNNSSEDDLGFWL